MKISYNKTTFIVSFLLSLYLLGLVKKINAKYDPTMEVDSITGYSVLTFFSNFIVSNLFSLRILIEVTSTGSVFALMWRFIRLTFGNTDLEETLLILSSNFIVSVIHILIVIMTKCLFDRRNEKMNVPFKLIAIYITLFYWYWSI